MNTELIPAVVAAGGGSALLAGIWAHEYRREEAMRASRVRLSMRFPLGVDPAAARSALSGLAGLPDRMELVFETAITPEGVTHCLVVPSAVRASVVSTMTGALPGLRLAEAPEPAGRASLSLRVFVPTPTVLVSEMPQATLAALAGLALPPGERVLVRWAIRPGSPRQLRTAAPDDRAGREAERAWQQKTASPGFQVSGLVLVQAPGSARAKTLVGHVASVIRSRRGRVGGSRMTAERSARSLAALPRTTRASGWLNVAEALPLLSWPIGDRPVPGVELGAARELAVPRQVPSEGRVLMVGHDADGERTVALSTEAARHHLCVVGPTGTGKSTLLANAILSDIIRGFGGVAIDGKGPDLVNTVLDHLPPEQAHRVAVLDPADVARGVPGVALLSAGDPDIAAEMLTGALKSIFSDAWGVRSDLYGGLAIRTLAEMPEATLADMGRLFTDEPFRRAAIARLSDPFLVSSWQNYEELSNGAKAEHVQAPMHRVMGLLSRPSVRAVLASRNPTLDIGRLLEQRRFLLISLSPGQLGEAAASLLGTALLYVVWSATEARSAVALEQRRFVALYIDELASLGRLPFSFEQLAERSRGLGAGLTVALQTLSQVSEPMRTALLNNCASFVTFRSSGDAPAIARQLPGLSDRDIVGLDRFEVAARIGTGIGSSVSVVTGRTLPLPALTGMAETIRDRSAARYATTDNKPEPSEALAPNLGPDGDLPLLGRAGRRT